MKSANTVIGLTISVTAKKPFAKDRFEVTSTGAWCPMIPTPIMVMRTAAKAHI